MKRKFIKKRILLGIAGVILLLSGCSSKKEEPVTEKPPAETPEKEMTVLDPECLETIEKTAFIHLGDVVEDSYQESIDCELDQEDIEALKSIKDELVMENTPSIALTTYYKLTLYDVQKEVLDTWTVDSDYKIEAGAGYGLAGKGRLVEWLESVEKKNGITYKGVICDRTPGKNYLQMLDEASYIDFSEITENNFVEEIDYSLEKEDIEAIKSIKEGITFGEEKRKLDNYFYQIYVFTESKAGLYLWTVDFDGKIYSDGYEMKSKDLRKWLDTIEEKSGLAEKRKKSNGK